MLAEHFLNRIGELLPWDVARGSPSPSLKNASLLEASHRVNAMPGRMAVEATALGSSTSRSAFGPNRRGVRGGYRSVL
jgi:hypothetical protein